MGKIRYGKDWILDFLMSGNMCRLGALPRFGASSSSAKSLECRGICTSVAASNRFTAELILRHISVHKYLRKIADTEKGIVDFVSLYQWAVRQTYCSAVCGNRKRCTARYGLGALGDDGEDIVRKFISELVRLSPAGLTTGEADEIRAEIRRMQPGRTARRRMECSSFCPVESEFYLLLLRIILHDIPGHNWLRHIPEMNIGVYDFLCSYFWIFKDVFLHGRCVSLEKLGSCQLAREMNTIAPNSGLKNIILETIRRTGGAGLTVRGFDEIIGKARKAIPQPK